MKEIYDFLNEAGTYYLGTLNNGKVDIRPFGTVNIYNNKLYIQTGKIKDVYKQMKENSCIFICAMNKGEWIRISADAIEDDDIEASRDMMEHYPSLQGMYKAGDGNCTVFYLENIKARISSFSSEDRFIEV